MLARWAVVSGAGLLFVLSGCTAAPAQAPSVAPTKDPASLSSPEVAEVMGDCLRDKGWDVVGGRTSTGYAGPPEQADAFQADLWKCYEDLGFADVKPPDYTPEYLSKKYEQELRTRTCLIEQGQDVPELPSLQAYSDMFFNDGTIYTSYGFLPRSEAVTDALRKICGDPLETWGTDVDR